MVAIVNEAFLRSYLEGVNPVGMTLHTPGKEKAVCRIVGMVRNTKYLSLQEDFQPIIFFPVA